MYVVAFEGHSWTDSWRILRHLVLPEHWIFVDPLGSTRCWRNRSLIFFFYRIYLFPTIVFLRS